MGFIVPLFSWFKKKAYKKLAQNLARATVPLPSFKSALTVRKAQQVEYDLPEENAPAPP